MTPKPTFRRPMRAATVSATAATLLLTLAPPAHAATGDYVWYLRNSNSYGTANPAYTGTYDGATAFPFKCDGNGDGADAPATWKSGRFYLGDHPSYDKGIAFGYAEDFPICGDWDGDGDDTIGVVRGRTFYVRKENTATSSFTSFTFGNGTEDAVLVGDWNGDGKDGVAVVRGNAYYLRNSVTSGPADISFTYGRASDFPLAGDFNADKKDTIAVRRGNRFYIDNALDGGAASKDFIYGLSTDYPVMGDWDGAGPNWGNDTVGVVRVSQ